MRIDIIAPVDRAGALPKLKEGTMSEAAEVIQMQDQVMVKEFGIEELTAKNIDLMQKQILEIPENPETKDQYESAYRFNVDAKKLLPRIEERRKELKAPVLERGKLIDTTAKKAVAMVQPLIDLSGTRREAWEEIKAQEKAEKDRQEADRAAAIQAKVDMLNHLASKCHEYNRPSEDLARDLAHLESFEISAVDFQERTEEAEQIRATAIAATKTAFENRKQFEAEQAEAARVKAEQEAEAKRLEAERKKLEAQKREQKKAARKAAEAEAEKRRQEEERLRLERETLEAEKADAAHKAIVLERESVWEIAHQENFDRDHEAALAEHEQFKADLQAEEAQLRADAKARWEATEKAKAKAAERAKLVDPDKMMITTICADLDNLISQYRIPVLNTEEANTLVRDMVATIKETIHYNEQRGAELA